MIVSSQLIGTMVEVTSGQLLGLHTYGFYSHSKFVRDMHVKVVRGVSNVGIDQDDLGQRYA